MSRVIVTAAISIASKESRPIGGFHISVRPLKAPLYRFSHSLLPLIRRAMRGGLLPSGGHAQTLARSRATSMRVGGLGNHGNTPMGQNGVSRLACLIDTHLGNLRSYFAEPVSVEDGFKNRLFLLAKFIQ